MTRRVRPAGIAWRTPLRVLVPGVGEGLACRYCVADYGLRGADVGKLPTTLAEFDAHLAEFHADEQ